MKPSKHITESEEDVRRILIFVTDLLKDRELGLTWMKTPRFKGKNAIEMINEGKIGDVLMYIHKTLF